MLKVELWTINQYTHPGICMNSSRAVCKAGEVVPCIDLFVQYATAECHGFMNDAVSSGHYNL